MSTRRTYRRTAVTKVNSDELLVLSQEYPDSCPRVGLDTRKAKSICLSVAIRGNSWLLPFAKQCRNTPRSLSRHAADATTKMLRLNRNARVGTQVASVTRSDRPSGGPTGWGRPRCRRLGLGATAIPRP